MTTSKRQHRATERLAWFGVSAATLAIGLAACRKPLPEYVGARASSIAISDSLRGAILASAATLQFDSLPPAAALETLWVAGLPRAIATAAPERNTPHLSRQQLAQGRIIVRITSDSAFLPLGIAAGHTFFWVDSTSDAGWRALMVPESRTAPVNTLPLRLNPLVVPDTTAPATARWLALTTHSVAYYINGRCNNTCCIAPGALTGATATSVDSAFAAMH